MSQVMETMFLAEWRADVPDIAVYYERYYMPRVRMWARWFRVEMGHVWCESDGYVGPPPSRLHD